MTKTGFTGRLDIQVTGYPAPQGSKVRLPNGGMRESSAGLAAWRADVQQAAHIAMCQHPDVKVRPLYGRGLPLSVTVVCYLPPPQTAIRQLERGIPVWPTGKPDGDKLLRGVLDALTLAAVWADDGQIVISEVNKRYAWGRPPGADIHIVVASSWLAAHLKIDPVYSMTVTKTCTEHQQVAGAMKTLCGIPVGRTKAVPASGVRRRLSCVRCTTALTAITGETHE